MQFFGRMITAACMELVLPRYYGLKVQECILCFLSNDEIDKNTIILYIRRSLNFDEKIGGRRPRFV